MADFGDTAFRLAPDSDIARVYPGTLVQVFLAGTQTQVTEVTTDSDGNWEIASLPTGHYDIRIGGVTVRSIHHVKSDHIHPIEPTWLFTVSGAITADSAETDVSRIFVCPGAGDIVSVRIVAEHVTVTGDVSVHLLKGAAGGATALTLSETCWNHRITPGSEQYRYAYVDAAPGVSVAANDCLLLGIDHHANGVSGITVEVVYRPDAD